MMIDSVPFNKGKSLQKNTSFAHAIIPSNCTKHTRRHLILQNCPICVTITLTEKDFNEIYMETAAENVHESFTFFTENVTCVYNPTAS